MLVKLMLFPEELLGIVFPKGEIFFTKAMFVVIAM